MSDKKFVINGIFLSQEFAGIQRMAYETMRELDKLVDGYDVELLIPIGAKKQCEAFRNIHVVEKGNGRFRKKWLIGTFYIYARKTKRTILNLTYIFPSRRDSIGMLADVRVREGLFQESILMRLTASLKEGISARIADKVITISEFSKNRISELYKIPKKKIEVIPCGWEHFNRLEEDTNIFYRFPKLAHGGFYYTVGSLALHKNYRWILEAANKNSEALFVVTGGAYPNVWKGNPLTNGPQNLIYTGRISDGEMKALMKKAKAFLFPTLYEGFGIPPLEAMSVGTDCIVSDIPVMREIYGDSVRYIDPNDYNINLEKVMQQTPTDQAIHETLAKNRWEVAAKRWFQIMVGGN